MVTWPILTVILLSIAVHGSDDVFISFGCWGGEFKSRARQRKVADLIRTVSKEAGVRYVVAAGDNFYRKGVGSTDDPRWVETFEGVYPDWVTFYAALGNHDYRGNIWAQVNYTRKSPSRWQMPHPYYSFIKGNIKFIVLDTVLLERCVVNKPKPDMYKARCWDDMAQWEWVKKELETPTPNGMWKIVVGHYPLHANGPHENKKWLIDMLCPLFTATNVSAYINADNHYMQYALYDGVYYLNSGGGAGYMPHTPHDRGYRVSPYSLWSYFSDGIFLHKTTPSEMTIQIFTPPGGPPIHNLTVPNRNYQHPTVKSVPLKTGSEGSAGGRTDKTDVTGGGVLYLVTLTAVTFAGLGVVFRRMMPCFRRRRHH